MDTERANIDSSTILKSNKEVVSRSIKKQF